MHSDRLCNRTGLIKDMATTLAEPVQPSMFITPQDSATHHFVYYDNDWQTPAGEEHAFMNNIRDAITEYCVQSAAHSATDIKANMAADLQNPEQQTELTPLFRIVVGLHTFGSGPLFCVCRPGRQKHSNEVEVLDNDDGYLTMKDFLDKHFPAPDGIVGNTTMASWWRDNGKSFPWADLPTELKEHVIQYCMNEDLSMYCLRWYWLGTRMCRRTRRGIFEITDKLGNWSNLLQVSYQVRSITLRLCVVGSKDVSSSQGLQIVVKNIFSLKSCVRRLGKYYQMTEPDAVPLDEKTFHLASMYKKYPKLYPHLKQYSTFGHGIQKMCMEMDFLEYMHFFKVTVGGFQRFWNPAWVDYQVFDRLPQLNELIIKLSDPRGRLKDNPRQRGPSLFYPGFECPRILHRIIYDKAAEVLAPDLNVKMYGFMDEVEEAQFVTLRQSVIEASKFSKADLEELYADDDGGVELEHLVYPDQPVPESDDADVDSQHLIGISNAFWPLKCTCPVLCRHVLFSHQ